MMQGQEQSSDASSVQIPHGAPSREYNGTAGFNQAKLFDGHQAGSKGSTSPINTGFEGGPKQEVKTDASGPYGSVRTLCKNGRLKEALQILNQQSIQADSKTYVCLLQECINRKDLAKGKQVHSHIAQSRSKPNIFLLNTLINMYAKCGSVMDARQVFDQMHERDMFTWTMMIAGYAKHGHAKEAFKIYAQMQCEGVTPDKVTFICVLNACASLGALEKAKEVHADLSKAGIASYINLENTLVDMYAKCGSMKDARQVFDNMAERDVVTWSAMIAGYAQHGCGREAFKIYDQMQREGVTPNRVTFICILNACASLGALQMGKEIHMDLIKAGIGSHIYLENTLVDMYAKCGSVTDARLVFDNMAKHDLVSWSALIAGYAQGGYDEEALQVYEQMQEQGVKPDRVTFTCVLSVCSSLGALGKGKQVHAAIMEAGIGSNLYLENTLVDMYANCGSMKDAHQVFDNMAQRDVVSWNAIIGGHTQHGGGREAVKIYEQMQQEGLTPDMVTFTCILNACASLGALEKGKRVHVDISKCGIVPDIILENTLVDMYAKCGSFKDAQQVFDNMTERDVISWNAMIAGYAQHGRGRESLQLFEQMQQEGLKPDSVTFISIISACSHVGLVEEGCHYFDSMSQKYGLTRTLEHFGCMVDLLGRAGQLDEAEEFINRMSLEPDAEVWRTLLGACRIHGNVEVAERVAKSIFNMDPQHPAAYVLLSNIYAGVGRYDDKAKVRTMMEDRGVRKEPGCSCIEVANQVHTFLVNDNCIHKLRRSMLS